MIAAANEGAPVVAVAELNTHLDTYESQVIARNLASFVITPLFFDFIGKLRNLEPLKDEFLREFEKQSKISNGLRLLRFPRVQQIQQK